MPFSFQLLVEFFFPGLIVFGSFLLTVDLILPAHASKAMAGFATCSATLQVMATFVLGLVCYFLGAVINGVSNRFIRIGMAPFRCSMIRRKLGLKHNEGISDLSKKDRQAREAIEALLPAIKSDNMDDQLNEVYAAARTFSAISSDRAGKLIDYHWSLVRLSRATLLPLGFLTVVFFIRCLAKSLVATEGVGLFSAVLLLGLTLVNYKYREKFLVYTTFDLFFLSARVAFKDKNSPARDADHRAAHVH